MTEENRRQRLIETRGYSDEKIEQIFAAQLSEGEYRRHCQVVIDNNGPIAQVYLQLAQLLNDKGDRSMESGSHPVKGGFRFRQRAGLTRHEVYQSGSCCICSMAKRIHWLINSLRLISAAAALRSISWTRLTGNRTDMISFSDFTGRNSAIIPPPACIIIVFLVL